MSASFIRPVFLCCLLLPHFSCPAVLPQDQGGSFNAKIVDLTISEISRVGPDKETAQFVARSMDLLWPKRNELLLATAPHLNSPEAVRAAASMEILYRLRSYQPRPGFGFDLHAWRKEQAPFFSAVDKTVFPRLNDLLGKEDGDLLRNLALYLGVSPSPRAKEALLELAERPGVAEQALICLTWHQDVKDMDELMPFMLRGGREAAALPYSFRHNYGSTAAPYLLKAISQASHPQVRLQAAFELVHLKQPAGVRYLYDVVLHRAELPNGTAQAEEIMTFARDYMGFPATASSMEELLAFLKAK